MTGQEQTLEAYKGKPVMIVNIATQCGYTPQLKGLETIYQQYKDKGFAVIGVPSNDFGGQTPEGEPEIKKFCEMKYQTTFPLTTKSVVKGESKIPLFKELIAATGNSEVKWNFEKFLIDKSGKVTHRFESKVAPDSSEVKKAIESVL